MQVLKKRLNVKLDYKMPVYRKFASLEEQNDWFAASDKPLLSRYLSPKILRMTMLLLMLLLVLERF